MIFSIRNKNNSVNSKKLLGGSNYRPYGKNYTIYTIANGRYYPVFSDNIDRAYHK